MIAEFVGEVFMYAVQHAAKKNNPFRTSFRAGHLEAHRHEADIEWLFARDESLCSEAFTTTQGALYLNLAFS